MEILAWGPVVGAILIFVGVGVYMRITERKLVREGHCGRPWKPFDMDSQGGLGLKCRECGRTRWVSWYFPTDEEVTETRSKP